MMLCFLCGFVAAEKKGPKVFISVDMEGIWGVVNSDQVSTQGQDYGQARKWMAEAANCHRLARLPGTAKKETLIFNRIKRTG